MKLVSMLKALLSAMTAAPVILQRIASDIMKDKT
jgi:hypothetical protein